MPLDQCSVLVDTPVTHWLSPLYRGATGHLSALYRGGGGRQAWWAPIGGAGGSAENGGSVN